MKKIGFYLFNRDIINVDFRFPLDGNPGVGGSEYLIVLTAWQLSVRDNGLDVTLYIDNEGIFPDGLKTIQVTGIEDALEKASNEHFDTFVIDHKRLDWTDNPFSNVKHGMSVICWCHNFVTPTIAKRMIKSACVSRVIAVGREQMDLYRDDRLFLKSDYIYNAVPVKEQYLKEASLIPYQERPHRIAYLGSLVKDKNFHILASIWPRILDKVPDAELFVIGSGKVYSQNAKLGKYGIADEKYEDMFMPYLTDKDGNILPSVNFLGAMGDEKYDVLRNIRVGCPNPTGASETFCLSAVEMQAMGCTVAAMEAPGYYDTFFNGKISKNIDQLVNDIVNLLQHDSPKSYKDTIKYIQQHFSVEVVMKDWEKLLLDSKGSYLHPILPLINPCYRLKWLKEWSKKTREALPVLYAFPNIDRFISLIQRITLKIRKIVK